MNRPARETLLALILILTALATQAPAFSGQVRSVHDGDTLTVGETKVRLYGIDAPELDQPGGKASRDYLQSLVYGELVEIVVQDTDVYGRTVGKVILRDGRNACSEMVKAGQAWVYRKYCQGCYGLIWAEAWARWRGLGLWAETGPIPPWQWRKQHRRTQFGH